MSCDLNVRKVYVWVLLGATTLAMTAGTSCPVTGDNTRPVVPPGNRPPRIIITSVTTPGGTSLAEQGDPVSIAFTGEDAEDAAIARVFVSTQANPTPAQEIPILAGFPVGPGTANGVAIWDTSATPTGIYNIFAEIDDRTFDPFTGSGNAAVRVTWSSTIIVSPPGTAPTNGPPVLLPKLPGIDIGLGNEDNLIVRFDVSDPNPADSIALTVFLDTDRDASNDATSPPIQLDTSTIPASTAPIIAPLQVERVILINLANIPLRRETDQFGRPLPYFVRIRANDGKGGVVNAYTQGAVRLLASASGVVDMLSVGGRIAGATFQGFGGNPTDPRKGDHAGSSFAPLGDMDLDGIDDFAIIAETASPFGNPNVGQVYSIYGKPRMINPDLPNSGFFQGRLSGILDLNSVGAFVPFPSTDPRFKQFFRIRGQSMPHSHEGQGGSGAGPSLGVTSIVSMPDESGDGRPEMITGAPFNTNVPDAEDLDPCDLCVFPEDQMAPFQCMSEVTLAIGNAALTGNIDNIGAVNAGTWRPFNPSNPNQFGLVNVDLSLDEGERILSIESFAVKISGTRVDMSNGAVNIELQLENDCGPKIQTNAPTDMNGAIDEHVAFFPIFDDMAMPPDEVELPVGQGDSVPPSVYDGIFTLFIRPVTTAVEFDTIEVEINAVVGNTGDDGTHPIMAVYFDGLPPCQMDNLGCADQDPPAVDPFGLNFLVTSTLDDSWAGIVPPPINREYIPFLLNLFAEPLPVGSTGLIDAFVNSLYQIYLDGHLCQDVGELIGNQAGVLAVTDDMDAPYQSALVYVQNSDELLTTINAQGTWNGDGCPVQPLGQFGQSYGGCLNDAIRGARFRGAWYNPAVVGDGLGGEYTGPYDPTSMLGYTVDVLPDIDSIFGTSELMLSAPGGGVVESLSADLTASLGGMYNSSGTPTKRVATFDLQTRFSRVLSASLLIRGEGTNIPRLKVSINDTNGMPIPGADSTLILWNGANFPVMMDSLGTLGFRNFFGQRTGPGVCDPYRLAVLDIFGGNMRLSVVPEVEFGCGRVPGQIINVGSLIAEGVGSLTLEIMPDFPIEGATAQINQAVLNVVGLVPGWGYTWLIEGQDYTNDELISTFCNASGIETDGDQESGPARPMSWPSTGCCDGCSPELRRFCYPQGLAFLVGERRGDGFGWARHAGDPDFDGVADIICGAPLSDNDPFSPDLNNCPCGPLPSISTFTCTDFSEPSPLTNNGKTYLIYGEPTLQNGPPCRYERFEVRGSHNEDQFGRTQGRAGDVNGDSIDDVFIAAENYDATGSIGGIQNRGVDAGFVGLLFGGFELTGEVAVNAEQIGTGSFHGCKFVGGSAGARLGGSEPAKVDATFYPVGGGSAAARYELIKPIIDRGQSGVSSAGDFNRDGIDDLLITAPGQEWPGAKIEFLGGVTDGSTITINGRVFEFDTGGGVAAGRVRVPVTTATALGAQAALFSVLETSQADESLNISAVTSRTDFPDPLPDTPTITFLARTPAGFGVSSATGTVPVTQFTRKGVAYLIFGSDVLLTDKTFYLPEDLNRRVGGNRILKGVVFVSSFEKNTAAENDGIYDPAETPDEAPIEAVSAAGDVDGDGFPDILLGAPRADFINIVAPNQRRQASGEAYLIYGNEFGLNSPSSP